jgi:exodeoxyribonuclease V gamma subunit
MSGLRLFTSNRLEILADAMAEVLRTPLSSPLAPEILLVQSKGMERWISLHLAERYGIWANCGFPFPNRFIHDVFRKVLEDVPERSPFDLDVMTWRIMKSLPSLMEQEGFEQIRSYLESGQEELKRYQLSEKLADLFDQYLLFRPEMIFRWEEGKDTSWQAALWRELVKGHGEVHRAALARMFFNRLEAASDRFTDLPGRISVFGISALPRLHLQVLAALSKVTQVYLFLMNPCGEYWGDIVSDREMKRRSGGRPSSAEALHLEKGNSLLASHGALGRDFFDMIHEFPCEEYPMFDDPGEKNMLRCIQSDILNLCEKSGRRIPPDDRSIRFHSCHNPMREVEVLRDQLLLMFEEDPHLKPTDILVMTPDIETYAPYIQAVLDLPHEDPRRIPFSIADRSVKKESGIGGTLLAVLDFYGSRFGASQVLSLLESEAIRRRFSILEEEVPLLISWVRETCIRWGVDSQSRQQVDLPPFHQNTWRAGLDRLWLGYAMPGKDEKMFEGVLPHDAVEGSQSLVLGKFTLFLEKLFASVGEMGRPRALEEWSHFLLALLDELFLPDEASERETQVIRETLGDWARLQRAAEFSEQVGVRIIRSYVEQILDRKGFGLGFMTGGVTFCAMLPMRSIPFKVICLIGMNSDAYPRQSKSLNFDLVASHPRRGDRSRKHDDRYLFLEAILSAREKLYVSYTGQSTRDNSSVPPSVLVTELMDYLEENFEIHPPDLLVSRHRLQAFSPRYFSGDSKLFSYSRENCDAARMLLEKDKAYAPFVSGKLSDPDESWRKVRIEDLCLFFTKPAKFLLAKRFGIDLENEWGVVEDREPFHMEGLQRYELEQRMLTRSLSGKSLRDYMGPAKASGRLPPGVVGDCLYEDLSRGVDWFVHAFSPFLAGKPLDPLEVDLDVEAFKVEGRIENIYAERAIRYRYATVKAKDLIRAWIYHVALNCAGPEEYPRTTMVVGLSEKGGERIYSACHYKSLEDGEKLLSQLLEIYWKGLVTPLPFFPGISWEYAKRTIKKGGSREDALRYARNSWQGNDYTGGEGQEEYNRICFRAREPLDAEFQRISEAFFVPLIEHMEEGVDA